jgi:hypothetical protein
MIAEQWLAKIVPPRRPTSSLGASEVGADEAAPDEAVAAAG